MECRRRNKSVNKQLHVRNEGRSNLADALGSTGKSGSRDVKEDVVQQVSAEGRFVSTCHKVMTMTLTRKSNNF